LLKINYYLAVDSLRKYLINPDTDDPEENRRHRIKNFSFLRKIPELHKAYLSSRKFDHKFLEQAYKIQYCYQVGRFPYRIVIPIIQDRRIVSFTARDVTGKQNEKYLHLSNEEGEVPVKSCLYNLDAVKNQAILCEGPMDVWRVGGPAIAGFGTTLSSAQLELLLATDINKMYILFDADAKVKAEKLANDFSAFIQHVEVLYLKTGDPADLSQDQVLELKKQIGIDHE
jgi:DNA primase